MKKSRTFKMFSVRAAMLMFAAIFSAGAWAQNTIEPTDQRADNAWKITMHGDSESDAHIDDFINRMAYAIEYDRVFQVGVPATVVFPFPTTDMIVTGGDFYKFNCVDYDESKGQWVASMTSVAANNLDRNTPYIVVPTAPTLEFNLQGNTVHIYTGDATVSCDCWNFVGTYKTVRWVDKSVDVASSEIKVMDKDMNCVEVGDYYGFAAKSATEVGGSRTVSAGEFVKCSGDGYLDNSAFIYPLRAYLQYVGDDANNDTKKLTRQSGNNRPTSIAVVLRDANGEVTNVGAVSKDTGEIIFEGWFTIDGIKLPAEPTKSGVYIHNGKKVVVK
jgi:hypothetical protein